jgi:hypothetical protein
MKSKEQEMNTHVRKKETKGKQNESARRDVFLD